MQRLTALAVSLCLLFANLPADAIAESGRFFDGRASQTQAESSVELDAVALTLSVHKATGERTLYIIEDYHGHFGSQINAARVLDALVSKAGVDLAGLEGGIGELSMFRFHSIPGAGLRKAVAEVFMRAGFLSGPEYYESVAGPRLRLVGLEDPQQYMENLQQFRGVHALMSGGGERELNRMTKALHREQVRSWTPEALRWLRAMDRYDAREISHRRLLDTLFKTARSAGATLPAGSDLEKAARVHRLARLVQKDALRGELNALSAYLDQALDRDGKMEFARVSMKYRAKRIKAGAYFDWISGRCRSLGVDPAQYPLFSAFLEKTRLTDAIDRLKLKKETEAFGTVLADRFLPDERSRRLLELTREARLVANRCRLILREEEWNQARNARLHSLAAGLAGMGRRLGRFKHLEAADALAREFYETAFARDGVLLDKMLEWMDRLKRRKAVLFCGGFHSEGIARALEKRDISYTILTPLVEGPRENPVYLENILRQDVDATVRPSMHSVWNAIQSSLAMLRHLSMRDDLVPVSEQEAQTELDRIFSIVVETYGMKQTMESSDGPGSQIVTVAGSGPESVDLVRTKKGVRIRLGPWWETLKAQHERAHQKGLQEPQDRVHDLQRRAGHDGG